MFVRDAMQTRVVTLQADQYLPEAVVKMGTLDVRRLLVTERGCLVGLLTAGEITRTLQKSSKPQTPWSLVFEAGSIRVRDIMTSVVFTTLETDDLGVAIRSLLEHHVGGLPVLGEGGVLSGILTLTDVLQAVVRSPQPGWGRVREYMSSGTLSVTPEMPLSEAAARLTVSRLRVMPVTADSVGEHRTLLAVLHQQDIRNALSLAEAGHGPTLLGTHFFLEGQTVRDLMRPPAARILADEPLIEAVRAMLVADVHGLPVLSAEGDLLGVITVSDVLRAMVGVTPPAPAVPVAAHV